MATAHAGIPRHKNNVYLRKIIRRSIEKMFLIFSSVSSLESNLQRLESSERKKQHLKHFDRGQQFEAIEV
jgi:hypothetical protein